ncbi:hypothetical protein BKA69DRAFT_1123822 [Paraphysoderma sedebokerense]|nr:hypothetical protein BKA69DRAFT_1123822 [Paraphysoderma sedebokerense]
MKVTFTYLLLALMLLNVTLTTCSPVSDDLLSASGEIDINAEIVEAEDINNADHHLEKRWLGRPKPNPVSGSQPVTVFQPMIGVVPGAQPLVPPTPNPFK